MHETLIDVTRLLDRGLKGRLPTGIDRVSLQYIGHFGAQATALVRYCGQWIELSRRDSEHVFADLLASNREIVHSIRWTVAKSLACNFLRRFPKPRFLFNTGHSGLESVSYAQRVRQFDVKPLFFVHDLIPLTHPEYCRAGEYARHRIRMNAVLDTGYGVIANSQATQNDLVSYAETKGQSVPPTIVALLASAPLPMCEEPAPLGSPYFVMLGTIEPRKNHWMLLHLWRRLIEQFGDSAPRLVIIGQRGWECENVVDLLERCEMLKTFVIEKPTCSDAELASWLRHARALLFPSFAEGYGMPLVEALTMRVPVLASDLPVFREIAGGIPDYADPLDGKRWSELIAGYAIVPSPMRDAQCRRIDGFVAPTWNAHFAQVEEFMERLSFGAL